MQYKEFQSGKMQSDASMKTGHLIEKNLEHSDSGGDNEQQTHEKSALLTYNATLGCMYHLL